MNYKNQYKALAGLLAGAIVAYAASQNVTLVEGEINTVLITIGGAVITWLTVYLSPKNKG